MCVAGAQESEHTWEYVRIPSTAGAQIIERSRFLEVPSSVTEHYQATLGIQTRYRQHMRFAHDKGRRHTR